MHRAIPPQAIVPLQLQPRSGTPLLRVRLRLHSCSISRAPRTMAHQLNVHDPRPAADPPGAGSRGPCSKPLSHCTVGACGRMKLQPAAGGTPHPPARARPPLSALTIDLQGRPFRRPPPTPQLSNEIRMQPPYRGALAATLYVHRQRVYTL